jgi:hypothetical protein
MYLAALEKIVTEAYLATSVMRAASMHYLYSLLFSKLIKEVDAFLMFNNEL